MEEYKPNSHKSRSESVKRVEKVVSGTAKTRKKTKMRKLADAFLAEDITSVRNYLFSDVLVPAAKKTISELVSNGVDRVLYGESKGGRASVSSGSRISYWTNPRDQDWRGTVTRTAARNAVNLDEIVFDNRGDAERVLDQMEGVIEAYRIVSVLDLYDLAGIDNCPHTFDRYGWTDIHGAYVERVRDGYVIRLPRPMPID